MHGSRSAAWRARPRRSASARLVSPVTFRSPGLLAISVAQVDQMSGGRIELGIGAGWYEAEHRAYGFDFPDAAARFDSLTDQLAIIDGMWNTPIGETFSYTGRRTVSSIRQACRSRCSNRCRSSWAVAESNARRHWPHSTPASTTLPSRRWRRSPNASSGSRRRARPSIASARCATPRRWSCAPVQPKPTSFGAQRQSAKIPPNFARTGRRGLPRRLRRASGATSTRVQSRIYLQILDLSDLDHLDFIANEVAPLLAGHGER